MPIRELFRRLFVSGFPQRALLAGLIATLLLGGVQLRHWTWEKTRHVRFQHDIANGFYWGSEISDPQKLLIGQGKQYRYFLVKNMDEFPKTYLKKLLKEAYVNSLSKVKDQRQIMEGSTIVKSVSAVKRTKKPVSAKKKT